MPRSLRTLAPLALAAALLAAAGLPRPPAAPVAPTERTQDPATQAQSRAVPVALRMLALPPPPRGRAAEAAADVPRIESASAVDAPPRAASAISPTRADVGRGHLMLDRVERGDGPSIEIAWPQDAEDRRILAGHLERCAAWRMLLLADGRLWRLEDPAGQPWNPSSGAAPSGLLRDLDGPAAGDGAGATIRKHHGLGGGRLVAAVSRRWDARLLGGLDRLAAPAGAGDIRARYVIDGDRLAVADIAVSGQAVQGRIDLGPVSRCGG